MQGFLTVRQTAERARVAPGTVYRWRDEGRLTKYKDGTGRVWVDPKEVDELLRIRPVASEPVDRSA
jgi:excisionase family DNA binding protein